MSDFPLPASYTYGYVKGRVILSIADTAEDVDDKPQARAVSGSVLFTPMIQGSRTTEDDYPAIVVTSPTAATISPSGFLLDAEGHQTVGLVTGNYRVTFKLDPVELPGIGAITPSIDPFPIAVTAAHTLSNPFQLSSAVPSPIPDGTSVTTLVVPAGNGFLARATDGTLSWLDPAAVVGVSSWDDLEDKPPVIAAGTTQAAARDAIDAQPAGAYLTSVPDATTSVKGAVQLAGAGDTTSTTKAMTPATTKALFDALVGLAPDALNTLVELAAAMGNDPSFATTVASALAARVRTDTAAQGLTGTQKSNARTNIGAGTSDLAIGTTGTTAKAGNWTPGVTELPVSIPVDVFQASGGTWPSSPAAATQRTVWIGYPGRTDPPATTGRPAAVAGLDSYTLRT